MKSGFQYFFIICLMVLPLTNCFAQFKPNQVSGLKLWLRSDSAVSLNVNKVIQWTDCSGTNNNALQSTDNFRPILSANNPLMNNHPAISFDGVNDFLMSTTPITNLNTTSMSVFIVANGNNVSSAGIGDILFGINDYSNGIWINRFRSNECFSVVSQCTFGASLKSQNGSLQNTGYNFTLFDYIKTLGTSSNIYINQLFQQTTTDATQTSAFTNNNYYIGNGSFNYQGYYSGSFAEILVYSNALNDADRTNIENYLLNKYAPPVHLGQDIIIPYGICDTSLSAGNRYVHYLWSTGDTTHTINISQSGTYSVTVTNVFGKQSSDTVNVSMPDLVLHDFTFCLGDSVLINPNLIGTYSYLWMPGNITTPTFKIKNPGNYALTLTDLNNCHRTKTFTATADSFPVLASLGPDKKVCRQDIIGLISGAQLSTNYLWSNGSSNSTISINDALGSHVTYSLTVTNSFGCRATDSIHLFVNGVKPLVNFSGDSVCFGNPTHFTNLSSSTPPSQIISYQWTFGDDSSSSQPNPLHLYSHSGNFPVQLIAQTDSGCFNQISKSISVFPKPHANFLPLQGCSGTSVSFTDKSQCPGGTLSKWHWNFNQNNDTSSLQNPSYTFNTAGTFPVTLLATTDKG